jgi:cell division septation protein DedD
MRTNTLLTYLLYALLIGLISAAGYLAYKNKQDKAQSAQNEKDVNETLRTLGYAPDDSTAATGSSFATGSDSGAIAPSKTISRDGIEDEPVAQPAPTSAAPKTKPAATRPTAAPAATAPKTTAKGVGGGAVTPSKNLNADTRGGRYQVRAGSFSVMDNARDLLEKVIKMGYQQAEIGKVNGGKYATVVVMRTNDRAAATKIMDQLEDKGVDAFVFDTKKK